MTSLKFEGSVTLAVAAAMILCGLSVVMYARQLRSGKVSGSLFFWLPGLRCLAVFLMAAAFARPVIETRQQSELPGEIVFIIDNSQSMLLTDRLNERRDFQSNKNAEPGVIPSNSRLARALKWIREQIASTGTGDTVPRLRALTATKSGMREIANGIQARQLEDKLTHQGWADELLVASPIDTWLRSPVLVEQQASPVSGRRAIVLLSDGQRTNRLSDSVTRTGASAGVKIHTVGMGARQDLADVAIQTVTLPERITRTGKVTGKIVLATTACPSDQSVSLSLDMAGRSVWTTEQPFTNGKSEVQFDFPASALSGPTDPNRQDVGAEPITLTARAKVNFAEATLRNNTYQCTASVAQRASRVLVLDQHSRWETRYLHNLFTRHPGWEIELLIGQAGQFENLAELDLSEYDLLILGDITVAELPGDQEHQDFASAVRKHLSLGGGVVFIDGRESRLWSDNPIAGWLPRRADDSSDLDSRLPLSFKLREDASTLAALDLTGTANSDDDANRSLWRGLPPPKFIQNVRPGDADEVLAELTDTIDRLPVLVSRRIGAGRVLYCATDELWRWRYKVADEWHSRFWLQVALWLQRTAARRENEFVTLEASGTTFSVDEELEVLCRLKEDTGQPPRLVTIVLSDSSDRVVERQLATMSTDGSYRAAAKLIRPGTYNVRCEIEGYSSDAFDITLPIVIRQPPSVEFTATKCNEEYLKEIANRAKGTYRHESDNPNIDDLVTELSGSAVESEVTPLWSTAGWLATVLAILSVEWFLRWRVGLA